MLRHLMMMLLHTLILSGNGSRYSLSNGLAVLLPQLSSLLKLLGHQRDRRLGLSGGSGGSWGLLLLLGPLVLL